MNENKPISKEDKTSTNKSLEPMTGIIVDGEVFPFLMTCKDHDDYLKYIKTKK